MSYTDPYAELGQQDIMQQARLNRDKLLWHEFYLKKKGYQDYFNDFVIARRATWDKIKGRNDIKSDVFGEWYKKEVSNNLSDGLDKTNPLDKYLPADVLKVARQTATLESYLANAEKNEILKDSGGDPNQFNFTKYADDFNNWKQGKEEVYKEEKQTQQEQEEHTQEVEEAKARHLQNQQNRDSEVDYVKTALGLDKQSVDDMHAEKALREQEREREAMEKYQEHLIEKEAKSESERLRRIKSIDAREEEINKKVEEVGKDPRTSLYKKDDLPPKDESALKRRIREKVEEITINND
jgi:hypothetical protein